MKTKLSIVICFVLAASIVSECKAMVQPAAKPSVTGTKQAAMSRETKPIAANPPAKEDDSNDTEYFALLMDSHKVGYAIQNRTIDVNKVVTSISLSITVSRAGIPITIETTTSSTEHFKVSLLGFEFDQNLGMFGTSKTIGNINESGKLILTSG